ncbi:MAG: flagellar hook-length control protein FliK [Planctomycetaceae bacterium]|jgi:hypothetical protein|nr:flagellar hook-length control protein FliK [Planctomycetaceae bacterium]
MDNGEWRLTAGSAGGVFSYSFPKGMTETAQLRSAFLDAIQKQQQKHKDEPNQKTETEAKEKQDRVLSRSEHLRSEKKNLNKSELRSEQLDWDYNRRTERQETRQQEHVQKTERFRSPEFQRQPALAAPQTLFNRSGNSTPAGGSIEFQSASKTAAVNTAGSAISTGLTGTDAAVNVAPLLVSAETAMLPSQNTAAFIPPNVTEAVSAFTVFSAAGHLRKMPSEEKDKEKSEKKKDKSGSFLSLLQLVEKQPAQTQRKSLTDVFVSNRHETAVKPVEEKDEQTKQKNEPKKEIPFEKLLEPLKQPVPLKETVNTTAAEPQEQTEDRVQFVRRIAAACQSAANQSGTVRMKLDLGILGSITLWTVFKEQKLSVRFETEKEQTRQILSEGIDALRSSLAEQDITLDTVEFKTDTV